MDAKAMTAVAGVVILLFVVTLVIVSVQSSITLPTYTVYNESINLATNNTNYTVAHTPIMTIVSFQNSTDTINTTACGRLECYWIKTNTAVGMKSNATWENGVWLVTYTAQLTQANATYSTVNSSAWNAVGLLSLVTLLLAVGAILGTLGLWGRKD